MFGDSDLTAIFADFGVAFTWTPATGGTPVPATGILDIYEDVFQHGGGPGASQTTEFKLRVPWNALGASPKAFDAIVILPSPNLPPGFAPGNYTVKNLSRCEDPAIVDMILKGPVA